MYKQDIIKLLYWIHVVAYCKPLFYLRAFYFRDICKKDSIAKIKRMPRIGLYMYFIHKIWSLVNIKCRKSVSDKWIAKLKHRKQNVIQYC